MSEYTFERRHSGCNWLRYDVGGDGVGVRVVDKEDRSPYHVMYPNGYDSKCNLCWLNIPHTEALHTLKDEG